MKENKRPSLLLAPPKDADDIEMKAIDEDKNHLNVDDYANRQKKFHIQRPRSGLLFPNALIVPDRRYSHKIKENDSDKNMHSQPSLEEHDSMDGI